MRRRTRLIAIGILGAGAVLFGAAPAQALLLGSFSCITNNDAGDCAIGTTQLLGTIAPVNSILVILTITMNGLDAAVVEQVFIESSVVSGISFTGSLANGTVAFTADGSPGNLPGGNTVNFVTAASASADSPPPFNGIGFHPQDQFPFQSGTFLLTLTGDDLDPVNDLRVGVHVIGYTSGGSESFVTRPIPEPGTLLLIGTGLVGLGAGARRRKKQ